LKPAEGWNSYRLILEMQVPENNLSVGCNTYYQSREIQPELQLLEHPLNGTIRFKVLGLAEMQDIQVKISSMTGAEIRKLTMAMKGTDWMEINQIPQGVYTLSIISNDKRWIRKILVK
jgi:hypothetical protein